MSHVKAQPGTTLKLSTLSPLANAHVKVTFKWRLLPELKNPPEGDAFCFMRDKNGHAPTNEDFIFFNNMQSERETVILTPPVISETHGVEGVQTLIAHLGDIRYEITELLAGFNLYRADERDQSLRFLQSLSMSLTLEDGTPLLDYDCDLQSHKTTVCLPMLSLKREGQDWELTILDDHKASFNDIARESGIVTTA